MRPRDFERLASTSFDVLVIGGGIYGLSIALDAATRGLRTALIDAADFGSGSSLNHQKIAYGGMRLNRARYAIRERRALARMAPWLLRPIPVIVGTYRSVTRSRLALRAAFKIDGWVGRHRNHGVEPELHLPAARLVSKAATLRLFPGIRQEGLTGSAQWYDYQIVDNDRFTIAFAAAADRAGADLANYVETVSAIRENGRVAGMRVRDAIAGNEADIRARVVVNAAGADAGRIMQAFGVNRPVPLVRTMNLVTSRRASDIALTAPGADGRMLTLAPWQGRAIIGTGSSSVAPPADRATVTAADVDAFIGDVNRTFPALKLQRADATVVHSGLVPATEEDGRIDALAAPRVLDHSADGVAGAITVLAAHHTSARRTARHVVALAARDLGQRLGPPRLESTTLPGAGIADHEALAIETARARNIELPQPLLRHLIPRYAEHAAEIVRLMASDARLREPLDSSGPSIGAEVIFAIRHEMAVRLSDIVIRRMGLGAARHPGGAVLQAAAFVAAPELGWDSPRLNADSAEVDRLYDI